ncbi:ASCH domain-containing protein [Fructilactobacillus sp. Tb1]|uniref:ASCH domain-containing protein n=1 Tax=Fructilactobacillus sp. Tb1 TaxID=3422304 RepID=UPI003D2D3B59
MTPEQFFQQAKEKHDIPADAKLQSSFQFGVAADKLAELVLSGTKTATTSNYDLYVKDNDPLPGKGAYDVIFDNNDSPICIIQNDDVQVVNYLDVDATHAFEEGEGDRTLTYWRKEHDNYFSKECQSEGEIFDIENARVVLEKFHVVYPKSDEID